LASGEPLAYIIGQVPFLNTTIHLDSHPLIPRPETEFWVVNAIAHIKHTRKNRDPIPVFSPVRMLDLCAGSGCIGVAVAKAIPDAYVTFAELDFRHQLTIEKNLTTNLPFEWKVCGRYAIRGGDLFENVSGTFDVILSNPPYIDPAFDRTEESVKKYEPHGALYGGRLGLELIEQIIAEAPAYLTECGVLYLEHEPEQAAEIHILGVRAGLSPKTHLDQYNIARYTVLTRMQT